VCIYYEAVRYVKYVFENKANKDLAKVLDSIDNSSSLLYY
jgi:hypothetical protein